MKLNRGFEYRETCGEAAQGRPLLAYLASRYEHSAAETWRARIEAGSVLLDGQRVAPDAELRAGMVLSWTRPPWREPDAPLAYGILHVDPHLLAVAKPAGLPTVPAAGFLEHTLLWQVRRAYPEATPMHRLGRFTSGLVLFARTAEARSSVARAWRAGRVRKLYLALAAGDPGLDRFSIDVPIGPVPYPPLGTLFAATPGGRPSTSHVRVLERRREAFLAEVDLETGRPHQIRIHLAAAGHPLVGDPLYVAGGLPAEGSAALPGDPGYLLHASRLTLPPPFALDLLCDPPPELKCRGGT